MRTMLIPVLMLSISATANSKLDLSQYIRQVQDGNAGYKAADVLTETSIFKQKEGTMALTPQLFASMNWKNDEKPTGSPSIQGSKTIYKTYQVGVSQTTRYGLSGKLYYDLSNTEIQGASPLFVSQPDYFEARPTFELTQSLWRNWRGFETRATEDLAANQARATHYLESFKSRQKISEAENTYWRLVFARETLQVQKNSHERGVKIRDWNERRVKSQLADKTDLLQSEAALELRSLELEMAKSELMSASRTFNSLRGISAQTVEEELISIPEELPKYSFDQKPLGIRDDVRSSIELANASDAAARLNLQKTTPTLDLLGSYVLNGKDTAAGKANTNAFKMDHPTWTVGLKFSTSLNFGLINDVREGYHGERKAAELNSGRKAFEENQEWRELTQKYSDAQKRLLLTREIEKTQGLKLQHEKERLTRGRTTTYQVLQFEQEFAKSQLDRIRTQLEALGIITQLKLFGDMTGAQGL